MYEHERSLVTRLAGQPFALVGVNGDDDPRTPLAVLRRERLGMRTLWNGPGGADGPLARRWRVEGWPAVWVIDAKGVIRHRNVRGPQLDAAVDALLAEAGPPAREPGSDGG